MTLRSITVAAVALASIRVGAGQPAPLELKGIMPGMSYSAFDARFPKICQAPDPQWETYQCDFAYTSELQSIAEQDVAGWTVNFIGSQIGSIGGVFKSGSFLSIRDSLIAKFGRPSSVKTSAVSNAHGAKFEQITVEWRRGGSLLMIQRYASTIDDGVFLLASDRYIKRSAQIDAEKTRRRSKDL